MVAVSQEGGLCASILASEFGCDCWARRKGAVKMLSQVDCMKEDTDVFNSGGLRLTCASLHIEVFFILVEDSLQWKQCCLKEISNLNIRFLS